MSGRSPALLVLLSLSALSIAGCSMQSVSEFAEDNQMSVHLVEGVGFSHLVIQRAGPPSGNRLHVYIEGDGIPWTGNLPSADPTPRDTLALRLASQDSNDIAYVARPCYFGQPGAAGCSPKFWTSHRYGEEVLVSMAAAIERTRLPRHTEIVLIGHSGGGTLAALLESRVEGVVGVVSVAANLDIDAWAEFRSYDPLSGSRNPISETRNPDIPHWQFVGASDTTVPPSSSADYSRIQPNVELIRYGDFGHVCCWEEEWPVILGHISDRLVD